MPVPSANTEVELSYADDTALRGKVGSCRLFSFLIFSSSFSFGALCAALALSAMFLPFICLSAVNIVCWRFWTSTCASGCFVAWRLVLRWYVSFMPLFARFVRGFVGLLLLSVILLLSGGCRLCVCCVRRFLRFVRLFLMAVCIF